VRKTNPESADLQPVRFQISGLAEFSALQSRGRLSKDSNEFQKSRLERK
jgi:hypothetical protein